MMTNSRLNTRQIEIYKCFLYSDRVKKALATTLHAFHCLIVLQKMWGQLGRVPRSANHGDAAERERAPAASARR